MRWPIPANLPRTLAGLTVSKVGRRGKYLLIECLPPVAVGAATRTRGTAKSIGTGNSNNARGQPGWLILHLGMSGSLRVLPPGTAVAGVFTRNRCPGAPVDWCRARLAAFKVPRYVVFVDALPQTPTHRVAKYRMRSDATLLARAVDLRAASA